MFSSSEAHSNQSYADIIDDTNMFWFLLGIYGVWDISLLGHYKWIEIEKKIVGCGTCI